MLWRVLLREEERDEKVGGRWSIFMAELKVSVALACWSMTMREVQ